MSAENKKHTERSSVYPAGASIKRWGKRWRALTWPSTDDVYWTNRNTCAKSRSVGAKRASRLDIKVKNVASEAQIAAFGSASNASTPAESSKIGPWTRLSKSFNCEHRESSETRDQRIHRRIWESGNGSSWGKTLRKATLHDRGNRPNILSLHPRSVRGSTHASLRFHFIHRSCDYDDSVYVDKPTCRRFATCFDRLHGIDFSFSS